MLLTHLRRRTIFGLTTALVALGATAAEPETRATLNFNGVTGLIDMPSGESQPDGALNISTTHFGPISRTTLTFQILPRLSGSFRYTAVRDWRARVPGNFETYYDRSFDLRYQILKESQYVPAVTVGLQDFVGTGILSGEYIVATKNLSPKLKVTGGLGWGRLGSFGSFADTGTRKAINVDKGGTVNTSQFFRGPVSAFGGVEYQYNDKLSFKAEYSSDNYDTEAEFRQTFDRKSPVNFGVEYQPNDGIRLGGYYLYGSEFGIAAHFLLNPRQRVAGAVTSAAPYPIEPRPSRSADPDAWSPEWVTQDGIAPVLIKNINKRVVDDGIVVEAISYSSGTVQVRFRNNRLDAEAQAVGRVARAMSAVLPASVEVFEIVPVVNAVPASKVTLRRSDIEALEFAPDAATALRARATVGDVGPRPAGLSYDPELYPIFEWGLGPYVKTSFFDPDNPVRADLGVRLSARYEPAPGVVLRGSAIKRLVGNLSDSTRPSNSVLPRVRSNANIYEREGDPAIESLTANYYTRLGENLYGRATIGYLEPMFGGVSGEVLWKPADRDYAIGAEINYVRQRDFDQLFGVQTYSVTTGHVSGYYKLPGNYNVQLDVGRYLAGDYGATLSLDREFENGWRVGAFATLTDVSADDFGEGSFDKGIRLDIPVTWFTGAPTRKESVGVIRPLTRDGGARLNVDGRLYNELRDYQASGLDGQWGRFWK